MGFNYVRRRESSESFECINVLGEDSAKDAVGVEEAEEVVCCRWLFSASHLLIPTLQIMIWIRT